MSVIDTVAANGGKSDAHRLFYLSGGATESLSLAELDRLAGDLARRLAEAGLRPGERVGILARNGVGWVLLDLAAIKAGLVTAGFEYGKFDDPAALARRYGLAGMLADVPFDAEAVRDLRPLIAATLEAGVDAASPPDGPAPRYAPTDCTTLKFTSGSTGEPKGLAATAGSIESSIAAVQSIFAHGDGDNVLVFLPLSLLQQRYWIYSALAHAHDVTVVPFEYALPVAMQVRPTVIMGVPGFFESLKKRIERSGEASDDPAERKARVEALIGPRIRYLWTGSAPASPDMLAFFQDCGVPIFEGYGMNETCIVSKNHPGAHRRGSAGRLLPGKRARIDADGVLIVGSDHPVNTAYAYCAPGESEAVFLPGGEVRTGDLARIDEDGFLWILGRADDVVVLANGRNVHVRGIEERIRAHAAVDQCVLYGAGRTYLVAVVSPTEPGLAEEGRQAIEAHVGTVNETLAKDEQVRRTLIAPEPFSIEAGLLTSQFKPKRKEIYRAFGDDIAKLYGVAT